MRALAAAAVALALPAQVVTHRTPTVGPAFAGPRVAWGEDHRTVGSDTRILLGAPGVAPRQAWRLAPSTDAESRRAFLHTPGSFDASPLALSALALTSTVITEKGGDYVSETETPAAVGGPPGALGLLSGRLPDRGDAPCQNPARYPLAVAVDGARLAVAEQAGTCGDAAGAHLQVTITDGVAVTTVPVAGTFEIRLVALAGRHLLWLRDPPSRRTELVVRDLATGADAVRLSATALHARGIEDAALRPDGTVAFTFAARGGYRLGLLRPGKRGVRVLARHVADRGVAIAGGRVLYERLLPRDRSELVLRRLAGSARVLARFGPGHRRAGDVDLDATRATESRIVVQRIA